MIDLIGIAQVISPSTSAQTVERDSWGLTRTSTAAGGRPSSDSTCPNLGLEQHAHVQGWASDPLGNQAFQPAETLVPRDQATSLDRAGWLSPGLDEAAFRSAWAAITDQLARVEVEPGMAHAAEALLERQVQQFGDVHVLAALKRAPGAQTAALVHLMGRIPQVTGPVRVALVRWALGSPEPVLRDAAVQACEHWADPRLAQSLRNHRDPLAWLQRYAAGVADDLDRL